MTEQAKTMTGEQLRDSGLLQEANRRFFHPLGVALAVVFSDDTGKAIGIQVWDYRSDPEGIRFSEEVLRQPDTRQKYEAIEDLWWKALMMRGKLFGGSGIQPLPKEDAMGIEWFFKALLVIGVIAVIVWFVHATDKIPAFFKNVVYALGAIAVFYWLYLNFPR